MGQSEHVCAQIWAVGCQWFKCGLGSSVGERTAGGGVLNFRPMAHLESWNLTDGQDLGDSQVHIYPHFTDGESQRWGQDLPKVTMAQGPCSSLSSLSYSLEFMSWEPRSLQAETAPVVLI